MLQNDKGADRQWQQIAAEMSDEQDTDSDAAWGTVMEAEHERWRNLCEQAANEQDLERLLQLVREINRLLIKRLLQEKGRTNTRVWYSRTNSRNVQ